MVGEMEQRERFAYALQQAMDARRKSARQLAKDLGGMDARVVAKWLKGTDLPNLYQAERLVDVLQVRDDLFRNPPPVPAPPAYPIADYLLGPSSGEAGLVEGVRRAQEPPARRAPGTPPRSRQPQLRDAESERA